MRLKQHLSRIHDCFIHFRLKLYPVDINILLNLNYLDETGGLTFKPLIIFHTP